MNVKILFGRNNNFERISLYSQKKKVTLYANINEYIKKFTLKIKRVRICIIIVCHTYV